MGVQGQSEDAPSKVSFTTLEEKETLLPCPYELNEEKVVQVTWYKIISDVNKEQMITVDRTDGQYGRLNCTVIIYVAFPLYFIC